MCDWILENLCGDKDKRESVGLVGETKVSYIICVNYALIAKFDLNFNLYDKYRN